MVQLFWTAVRHFLEKLNIELPYDLAIPLLNYFSLRKLETYAHAKNLYMNFITALVIIAKKQKKSNSIKEMCFIYSIKY